MGALQRRELTTSQLLCRQGTPSHPQPSLSQCGCSGPTGQGCSHPQPTFWGVTNTPEQGPVQGQSGDFSLPSHPTYTTMICCPPQRCPREPPSSRRAGTSQGCCTHSHAAPHPTGKLVFIPLRTQRRWRGTGGGPTCPSFVKLHPPALRAQGPRGAPDREEGARWLPLLSVAGTSSVAGPNPALGGGAVNRCQETEAQPRWPKDKHHQAPANAPGGRGKVASQGAGGKTWCHQLHGLSLHPAATAVMGRFSTFHTFVTANTPHFTACCRLIGTALTAEVTRALSPRCSLRPAGTSPEQQHSWFLHSSTRSKSDARNTEMRLMSSEVSMVTWRYARGLNHGGGQPLRKS